jgi:hypothetical protein
MDDVIGFQDVADSLQLRRNPFFLIVGWDDDGDRQSSIRMGRIARGSAIHAVVAI